MRHAALVVIGGGPAGLAAARGFRAAGGRGAVQILAREPHLPYQRPPLTKDYLRGELAAGDLPLEEPGWFAANEISVETGAGAVALDVEAAAVMTEGQGKLAFDRCVLATGAVPARPDLPGADDPAVHTLRTVQDSDALRLLRPGDRVIVVGSGFIGCEAAASLAMVDVEVELVTDEQVPQFARLGREVGERLAAWLREAGVSPRLGCPVAAIEPGGQAIRLENRERTVSASPQSLGRRVEASAVVLTLGIEPDIALGREAGLEIDEGRVAGDASGRTSADGVLTAGDVARLHNPTAGRRVSVEHWGEALAQGEVAGRTAAGAEARWEAVPGFWSTIGSHTIKQAGWGDGHDDIRVRDADGGWTAWYGREGRCVGVLACSRDEDYERGRELVAAGAPLPE